MTDDAEYGFITRITGRHSDDLYLLRVKLTPMTRWGQLYLHVFHRPDDDPDPHDHPFHFWTFPLIRSYGEMVLLRNHEFLANVTRGWRWTRRAPEYAHKIVDWPGYNTGRKMITLVWRGPNVRSWGFWKKQPGGSRRWVHWREYLYARFRAEDDIVLDIIKRMSAEAKSRLAAIKEERLIALHHTMGRDIRNDYGLWVPENPFTEHDPSPNGQGVIDHPNFPDQVSQRIIEKVWRELRFEKWWNELRALSLFQKCYGDSGVERDAWADQFDEGYTPAEALDEDLNDPWLEA